MVYTGKSPSKMDDLGVTWRLMHRQAEDAGGEEAHDLSFGGRKTPQTIRSLKQRGKNRETNHVIRCN